MMLATTCCEKRFLDVGIIIANGIMGIVLFILIITRSKYYKLLGMFVLTIFNGQT